MKGRRTTLITAIAIGLLAGSAVGATSQDAASDPMAPAWVTGTIVLGTCSNPTTESVGADPVQRERGWRCEGQTWDASDNRLDGEGVSTWDADVYTTDEGPVSVRIGAYEVRNRSGGWSCRHSGVAQGAGLLIKPASGLVRPCGGHLPRFHAHIVVPKVGLEPTREQAPSGV